VTEALSSPSSPAAALPGQTPPTGRSSATRRLGDVVVELGLAEREAVESSANRARQKRLTIGENLLAEGVLSPNQLARAVAERFGADHVDLAVFQVDPRAAARVQPSLARRYDAVPIAQLDERTLLVVTADPGNFLGLDDLATITGYEVRRAIASPESVQALLDRLEEVETPVSSPQSPVPRAEAPVETEAAPVIELRGAPDAPVAELVRSILGEAVDRGASDVHFEPVGEGMRVRFRVDGGVADAAAVEQAKVAGLVSRIKVMAGLDATQQSLPQEGRAVLTSDDGSLDLRVSTLPVVRGEAVVVRIGHRDRGLGTLDSLGMKASHLESLRAALHRPQGAVLVAGPRRSGASTTLRAAFSELNGADRTLASVEDPVERVLDGVKQVAIDPSAGLSFATALPALLRSDPDVVMVGEMRDRETAHMAIQAAAGGQLVLSALCVDDAPGAINRLTNAGIEPFLVASALECVVAQRLVRRLCDCKRPIEYSAEVLASNGFTAQDGRASAFEPTGCEDCGSTGYRGRAGLFELMRVSDNLRELVVERRTEDSEAVSAAAHGMRSLRDDGLEKIRTGVTSLAEVLRVL
jgi:type IV pilus assembly protein PilB